MYFHMWNSCFVEHLQYQILKTIHSAGLKWVSLKFILQFSRLWTYFFFPIFNTRFIRSLGLLWKNSHLLLSVVNIRLSSYLTLCIMYSYSYIKFVRYNTDQCSKKHPLSFKSNWFLRPESNSCGLESWENKNIFHLSVSYKHSFSSTSSCICRLIYAIVFFPCLYFLMSK